MSTCRESVSVWPVVCGLWAEWAPGCVQGVQGVSRVFWVLGVLGALGKTFRSPGSLSLPNVPCRVYCARLDKSLVHQLVNPFLSSAICPSLTEQLDP